MNLSYDGDGGLTLCNLCLLQIVALHEVGKSCRPVAFYLCPNPVSFDFNTPVHELST